MRDISLTIAEPYDYDALVKFMLTHFRLNEPIVTSVNATYDDCSDFFIDIVKKNLKDSVSIMAKNAKDELVGICLSHFEKHEEMNRTEFDPNIVDFKGIISEGQYKSRKANQASLILDVAEAGLFRLMPENGKLFKMEILAVRRDQMGKGIGGQLTNQAVELARIYGCTHMTATCTSTVSRKVILKKGFQSVKKVMFNEFLDNGKVVYHDVHDGGTSAECYWKIFEN